MGGSWDATNVVDGQVAVITPIGVDHARYLGERPEIAVEKAGIIKPGSTSSCAVQRGGHGVLVGSGGRGRRHPLREGVDFGVTTGSRPSAGS